MESEVSSRKNLRKRKSSLNSQNHSHISSDSEHSCQSSVAERAVHYVSEVVKKYFTVHCSELEPWKHINPYITHSYRHGYESYWDFFLSIFRWHNETMNIWTHLLGCLYFIYCALWLVYQLYNVENNMSFRYSSFSRLGYFLPESGLKKFGKEIQLF